MCSLMIIAVCCKAVHAKGLVTDNNQLCITDLFCSKFSLMSTFLYSTGKYIYTKLATESQLFLGWELSSRLSLDLIFLQGLIKKNKKINQ